MKRIFVISGLIAAMVVFSGSSSMAAEHGGHEHGGSSPAPVSSNVSSGAVTASDLQTLKDAAAALEGSEPSLAGKLRDLYHKLGGK